MVFSAVSLSAQQTAAPARWNFGLEQDFLPYATGGYYAGVWAGKGHLRGRALLAANVHKPDFIVPDGFTNNRVSAFAVVADYFLRNEWKGWWISAGGVYWNSSIEDAERTAKASYKNYLLNGSLGYQWRFYRHFYLSPWAGMHILVGGNKRVQVGARELKPALFNPEASLKLGWYF